LKTIDAYCPVARDVREIFGHEQNDKRRKDAFYP